MGVGVGEGVGTGVGLWVGSGVGAAVGVGVMLTTGEGVGSKDGVAEVVSLSQADMASERHSTDAAAKSPNRFIGLLLSPSVQPLSASGVTDGIVLHQGHRQTRRSYQSFPPPPS